MSSFKVKLSYADDPEVYRIVAIPDYASLRDLQSIMLSVMSWDGVFGHRFYSDGKQVSEDGISDSRIPLSDYEGKDLTCDFGIHRIKVEWLGKTDEGLTYWPKLLSWEGPSYIFDRSEKKQLDYSEVENSLQSWGVQGVVTEDMKMLPHMTRVHIVMALAQFPDGQIVFDKEEGEPKIVGKGSLDTDTLYRIGHISRSAVNKDKDRYITIVESGSELRYSVVSQYVKSKGKDWPRVTWSNFDKIVGRIRMKGLENDFRDYNLMVAMNQTYEWARKNGYYFGDEYDDEF